MKPRKFSSILNLSILLVFSVFAKSTDEVKPANMKLEELIPVDPTISIGEFENGLKYYIKVNKKPEKRAELWLVVKAGSVREDNDQRGLAHYVEHMAFNGTKHFKKNELINFLESVGMRMGPDLNGSTSFDKTVYHFKVPTDSVYYIEKGVQILEDWAHLVSFEKEEIEKERGVILEEWRLGQGAGKRMFEKQLPVIFKNSKYAERIVIGKKEIIQSCGYETLHRFYKDWYHPDMMAVIAVGDFDKTHVLSLVKKYFAPIPIPENPRERETYPVPDHDETLFAIATDKEANMTDVRVFFKMEARLQKTVGDYRNTLTEKLYNYMFDNRLKELEKKTIPPFISAYSGKDRLVRTKDYYYMCAAVEEDGITDGLEALLTEANRVKRFGFTDSELKRAKEKILRDAEHSYKEREKIESRNLVQGYVYSYLDGDPIPGPEQELALCKQLLPDLTLKEVNGLADKWITDKNRVVWVRAPEKENVIIPTEDKLWAIISAVEKKDIKAYKDMVREEPLVPKLPSQSEIVEEETDYKLGIVKLKLSNGVHVVLKATGFKKDEILFDAYSYGGNSLISDDKFVSAKMAAEFIREGGVGTFSNIELKKKLTGKIVEVNPYIWECAEGIRGKASSEDLETLFQLIYLYMAAPKKDTGAFKSYLTRIKGFIENRSGQPESAFYDTIQVTLAQHHPRSRPQTAELLDEVDCETAFDFYKDRFRDASDFHFFIVGNFDIDKIKPLIKIYLGGLPSTNRIESWKDTGISPPEGVVKKAVYRGMEPKSRVRLVFTGPYESEYKNYYELSSLVDVMHIKFRETLREKLGGTYHVGIWKEAQLFPKQEYKLHIMFGCAPERVDEMIRELFLQIDSLKTVGPKENYIAKERETQTRQYEVNLKNNQYWLNELRWKYYNREDLMDILRYPNFVVTLSAEMIQEAAKKYLNTENYIEVILYPEEMSLPKK